MIDQYELVTLKTGIKSLRSIHHQETFHPGVGPLVEARVLHVEQQGLVERCSHSGRFVIWDVGFGAAANAIAAIEALRGCAADVEIHSFDKSTSSIRFALDHAEELGYLLPHQELLRQLLLEGQAETDTRLRWHLHLGDFRSEFVNPALPAPQSVFYDPYSAVGNYEMWTLEHFSRFYQRLNPFLPCVLTNYTRSTAVRVSLLMAGFFVGVGGSIGEKAETTLFSNQLEYLQNPLGQKWLNRVRASTNSAPLRGSTYQEGLISPEDFKTLEAHPQFLNERNG